MHSAQMVHKTTINKCYIAPHLNRLGNLKERQLLHNKNAFLGFLYSMFHIQFKILFTIENGTQHTAVRLLVYYRHENKASKTEALDLCQRWQYKAIRQGSVYSKTYNKIG